MPTVNVIDTLYVCIYDNSLAPATRGEGKKTLEGLFHSIKQANKQTYEDVDKLIHHM